MGIISKFPSQLKQTTMIEQTIQAPEQFQHTIDLLAQIPDKYREKFHIKRLGDDCAPIMIYAPKYGGSTTFTPNEKTMMRFNYAEANEDELPLVKSIEIYEIGKFTITMTIDYKSDMAVVSTYIWY